MPAEVQFSFAQTEEDYREVLRLRYECYSAAGKTKSGASPESMGDAFDHHSMIIVGKHGARIICSVRIILHRNGEPLEQEQFVRWPSSLPARSQIAEVTRACVHQDFRASDVFVRMLRFFGCFVTGEQIPHVVICASEEMVSFYEMAGATKTGLHYAHTSLNGAIHHVMVAEVAHVVMAKRISPLAWCLLWKDAYDANRDVFLQGMGLATRLRLAAFSCLTPIADALLRIKTRQRQARLQRREQRNGASRFNHTAQFVCARQRLGSSIISGKNPAASAEARESV
jgi:N-acyl-L-homoserine lactone synthetase